MPSSDYPRDELSILGRLDVTSPDALLNSIAAEFGRLYEENERLRSELSSLLGVTTIKDRLARADRSREATEFPRATLIRADHALHDAGGFHELQYDDQGFPFRWTGPGRRSSLGVFVDRRLESEFELTFDPPEAGDWSPADLRCYVDGRPVTLTPGRRGPFHLAQGSLPAGREVYRTEVAFLCPRTTLLYDPAREAERAVGFRFRAFAIHSTSA